MAWHETEGGPRPKYLFQLKLTSNVRRAIAQVPWPLWEGAPTVGCQQLAETTVKLHGWSRERRVVIVRTLKPVNPSPQDEFWDTPEDDVAVYVTNLEKDEAKPEQKQIALLYAQRAVVTELAARLVLLTYNLWSLFTRLLGLNPGHHREAIQSRRDLLFLATQVVESGRQRVVKLAVKAEWWAKLKACSERLRMWLGATAPQLEAAGQLLRRFARQLTENPDDLLLQPASG
jgi:hypothetical protein